MMHFDAVIFDLDGVITRTALVHSKAWKAMFDEFLLAYAGRSGTPFVPFSHETDYLAYVDGKPRYKGVESFLASRGIHLPPGDPSDRPDAETLCGLGNRKNELFNRIVEKEGVDVYSSTIDLIRELKPLGIRTAVASSSKNCKPVLLSAGIEGYFPVCVDGLVSVELGLAGKPEPDIFITACRQLGCTPGRSVVVEDAVSGVQAGIRGEFGLVLGIARENNEKELREAGAHWVVTDLSEIGGAQGIDRWFMAQPGSRS